MGQHLFTKEELEAYQSRMAAIDELHGYHDRKQKEFNYDKYAADREACKQAHEIEIIKRAQARPDDFLNALLVLVGNRGSTYVPFESAFANNDDPQLVAQIKQHDTDENRRWLYTLLRGLSEIPKSWAMSAFTRFLRGTGKQAKAKYHGAGMFGVDYGWKAKEVDAFSNILAGHHYATGYSSTLMTYADVDQEIHDQYAKDEENNEYTIDYGTHFVAVRAERDVEFINQLCDILEKRGLAPVPRPKAQVAKKTRKPKVFKSGDSIRSATIRDLPLPAHVRIPIEKFDEESQQWLEAHIEHAVLRMGNQGYYEGAPVGNGKCYTKGYLMEAKRKLDGATYLGPWTGEKINKRLDYKFRHRPRRS
jgi:hypothetical protein